MFILQVRKYLFYALLLPLISYSPLSAIDVNLYHYEKRFMSQNGEDGILEKIFNIIGTDTKYYVEFGAGDGHLWSNTKHLREKYGWTGLLLEGGYPDNPSINLHQEFITAENIRTLFEKYQVPKELDLLSIDIDGNDFYVWKVLSSHYRPRVILIENNPNFSINEDKVIPYSATFMWDGYTSYYGASMLALFKLGRLLGYSLVYQESMGLNLFFIRDDIIDSLMKQNIFFVHMNDVTKLYKKTSSLPVQQEKFISFEEALLSK